MSEPIEGLATGKSTYDDGMMSMSHASARPCPRRYLSVLLFAFAALPTFAEAATALVRWLPHSAAASAYAVYVRDAGSPYGTTPRWTGNPSQAADGTMTATVTYTPAPSGTNYFTVAALDSAGESALATELPVGTVNLCRNDRCTAKTTCDFSNRPNGTPCDDGVFCNGPEMCVAGVCDASAVRDCADAIACTVDTCDEAAGRCRHEGPPGCCLACESNDPCLADACAEGDCSAGEGAAITVKRIRMLSKAGGLMFAAKANFIADPTLNPTVTGVLLEMLSPDGTLLYSSWVRPDAISAGASPGRYRFAVSRTYPDPFVEGLTRLDFRVKGNKWLLTAKAETEALMDAFLEPTLTIMIRMGDACVRRLDMPCAQKASASICR